MNPGSTNRSYNVWAGKNAFSSSFFLLPFHFFIPSPVWMQSGRVACEMRSWKASFQYSDRTVLCSEDVRTPANATTEERLQVWLSALTWSNECIPSVGSTADVRMWRNLSSRGLVFFAFGFCIRVEYVYPYIQCSVSVNTKSSPWIFSFLFTPNNATNIEYFKDMLRNRVYSEDYMNGNC